ncbi:helix-turn-helix transcriptional regulator [Candidatus Hepatincola sp. Av]
MHKNRSPKDVDIYAGTQLKKRRQELGLSQKALGSILGITFQQIQKYEKGLNRIGVSRLYDLCRALKTKPSYFFRSENYVLPDADPLVVCDNDNNEISLLIEYFNAIVDGKDRRILLDLAKSLSFRRE